MLDGFHRAAYRVHSKLPAALTNSDVYYVVEQLDEHEYRVTSYIARRPADLKPRPIPHVNGRQRFFRGRGLELAGLSSIEKVRISYGGYTVSEVSLNALAA